MNLASEIAILAKLSLYSLPFTLVEFVIQQMILAAFMSHNLPQKVCKGIAKLRNM